MVSSGLYIVTGGEIDLGRETARQLLKLPHKAVCLTFRDASEGAKVKKELGDPSTLHIHQLDICDDASVNAFADHIRKEHGEHSVCALINNEGTFMMDKDPEKLKSIIRTNYFGTRRMMVAFRALLTPETGRMVNLTSRAGSLVLLPDGSVRKTMEDAKNVEEIDKLAKDMMEHGTEEKAEWYPMTFGMPTRQYLFSKACGNAMTKAAAGHSWDHSKVPLISVCPAYVPEPFQSGGKSSDDNPMACPVDKKLMDFMSKLKMNSLEDAASYVVWAATVDEPVKYNGKVFGEKKEISVVSGEYV